MYTCLLFGFSRPPSGTDDAMEKIERSLADPLYPTNHPAEAQLGDRYETAPGPDTYLYYRPDSIADLEKQDFETHNGEPSDLGSMQSGQAVERAETIADIEKHSADSSPASNVLIRTQSGGVDVARAQSDFAKLSRELTGLSQHSRRLSRSQSRKSIPKHAGTQDVENAASSDDSEEPFDLESALRGNKGLEEEAGIKSKRIGVLWDGLTVSGIGGVKNYIKTFPDAFVSFFNVFETAMHIFGIGRKGREFNILRNFRGVVKPGEMVLVLGRPGSGCTTFLKVIANQRFGYTKIGGEVLYGPFDSQTFEKRYRGEAVYNQEDDVHHPTLTVGQTLGFALDTKTPGKRPHGMSSKDFKEKVIDLLLRMFNIEHTKNTIVGNPFVRGVSGGERTRGLDASTALDYAKSLRVLTNIYKTSTFVSLYQASESIYSQFDKVMVIDEGRQVYYGSAREARKYFEGLGFLEKPRQTTPDYLTGCTDPFERDYEAGRNSGNAPHTPDDFVAAFSKSDMATRLDREIADYRKQLNEERHVHEDFQTAVSESKRHAPKKSVYSIPFYLQIWALMQRQFILKWQDQFSLVTSWITSIVIAIVMGTVWLNLPQDSAGAFTRGGVLFIALLFNAFQAFGELASTMLGRPIVNKHRAYTFHRPSALWLAQIVVDLVFAAAQILLFSIIVYFMCGLVRDAGAFFTFYLVIVSGYLAMTLFFRTIGCLCPDFDYAMKFAAVIITLFVLTSGYLIQWQSEQVWLRWIFYLMTNEFKRIDLTCVGQSLIPSGQAYGDIAHQVCTLPGSVPGSAAVSGSRYIEAGFTYNPADLWRNWGIMVVLIVGFLIANAFLGEYIKWGAGGKTVTFFAKENKELKALNEELRKKKERQLRLLKNICGYVKPGTLTALMGASGAGKTTLLDVLAARKNIGVITGEKLVDGIAPGTAFQRGTSYAEQLDVHEASQTVREALRFSADLRQPYEVPQSEKYAYVEEVISLLEMEDIADAIIGDSESGLAVEQRKRVTIGVELAAKPELLLFLDEPTSGLDSQSAFNIVRFLRKLSAAGQAILSLFENFDRLLLLQRGGECVYFGDVGSDAHVLLDYFHRHGAHCPPDANPAEWMLDAIGAGQQARIGDKDWADIWRDSEELAATKDEIVRIKAERIQEVSSQPKTEQKEYATPLWHQIKTVNARTHKAFWRSPNYGFTRLFNHVAIALLTGLAYLQLDNSRASLQYRVFVIFQATVLPALILAQVEPKYDLSRLIFYRESAAKAYKQLPFALSMVLAEMPYITLAQTLSALTPSTFIAMLLNPFIIIIYALFCGVTIPKPQIPKFWRAWLYQLDPFTRLIGGMVVTELHGRQVQCAPNELNSFTAPPGQTCGTYMSAFFQGAMPGPGYITNNSTSDCSYCAYSVGDQFYEPLGFTFNNRWRDLGILAAFIGSNLVLLFVGSRYLNFNRR
ncbi:hypothetical protein LTR04_003110 [Oleoguttula sp. CCFEE 6159]|nr:hypothetical protein LTR04_003110 [Oleoguttula sp. CCFEE 6159]